MVLIPQPTLCPLLSFASWGTSTHHIQGNPDPPRPGEPRPTTSRGIPTHHVLGNPNLPRPGEPQPTSAGEPQPTTCWWNPKPTTALPVGNPQPTGCQHIWCIPKLLPVVRPPRTPRIQLFSLLSPPDSCYVTSWIGVSKRRDLGWASITSFLRLLLYPLWLIYLVVPTRKSRLSMMMCVSKDRYVV